MDVFHGYVGISVCISASIHLWICQKFSLCIDIPLTKVGLQGDGNGKVSAKGPIGFQLH